MGEVREDRGGLLREEEGGVQLNEPWIQYIRWGLTWVAYIDWHLHIPIQRT